MPRPSPPSSQRPSPKRPKAATASSTEDVDPKWLLKAGALVVLAAFICGYLTLWLLFYQGQWQLVLHPKRTTSSQPPVPNAQLVHFAPGESGTPDLTGWWIPATEGRYSQSSQTILLLRSGDGSLADDTSLLQALHGLGLTVFAFDYRGYGQSAPTHPSESRMTQDAASAFQYLRTIRNLSEQQIVPYGIGVGAALSTNLAAAHPQIPTLIIENPVPNILFSIQKDPRTHLIPLKLLFKERFELSSTLRTLHTPKLFFLLDDVSNVPKDEPYDPISGFMEDLVDGASDPKVIANLHQKDFYGPLYLEQLSRFLDEYPATRK